MFRTLMRTTLLLTLMSFVLLSSLAQAAPALPMARTADPDFEVATIRLADPADNDQGLSLKGRRISIRAVNVIGLICFAYSLQSSQIIDPPKWFGEQRWNIEGTPDVDGTPNWVQYRHMVRKLLAARFGVQLHTDKRDLSVYVLTVAKGGSKIGPTKGSADAMPDASGHGMGSAQYMKFTNHRMKDFAETMQLMVDKPVVDQTGLTGHYDFELLWTPDTLRSTDPDPPPALFTAVQEQLGLKLEAAHAMADVLIIDGATLPTAN